MGKGSKRQKKAAITNSYNSKREKTKNDDAIWDVDSEDEIDAFHKQRDVIPLDVNEGESEEDEETEQPIFDMGEDSDESKSEDEEINAKKDYVSRDFVKKLERQAKFMEQKFGGGEDEIYEDENNNNNENDENKNHWGGRKKAYYDADNIDYEIQSSDEEMPIEEENEVLRIQKEKAKSLSMADLGLTDELINTKNKKNKNKGHNNNKNDSGFLVDFEEVKKDHGSLSKEEQMDVVFSSAPELVGLLSELNETLDKLNETKGVNEINKSGVMNKIQLENALLIMYSQAVTFYLLLKSEGINVKDHPVIGRLVEIKTLLEKMKDMKDIVPSIVKENINDAKIYDREDDNNKIASLDVVNVNTKLVKEAPIENMKKEKEVQIGSQSLEMLKIRGNLEAKLKEKGLYNFAKSKSDHVSNTNGKLVNRDDFDDELQQSTKRKPQMLVRKAKKTKVISGDDDLPKRDDIGERRRKHELRVLARVGTNSNDNNNNEDNNIINDNDNDINDDISDQNDDINDNDESEDEFYKEAKKKQIQKKKITEEILNAQKHIVPSLEEEEADGKRLINYQISKNRGLTRTRKKLLKNPRKKYRTKHQEMVKKRKGQVVNIRKPSGPNYGGESTGINPNVSKSRRIK